MSVEYNKCSLCGVEDDTEELIWENNQQENIGVYLYGKIFVNENTYMALCKPCFKKRKYRKISHKEELKIIEDIDYYYGLSIKK